MCIIIKDSIQDENINCITICVRHTNTIKELLKI